MPGKAAKDDDCVKVVVRCRPMNRKEIEDGRERVVDMNLKTNQVQVRNPKQAGDASKPFTFDKIYDWNSMQEPVFEETARPIIDQVIGGARPCRRFRLPSTASAAPLCSLDAARHLRARA